MSQLSYLQQIAQRSSDRLQILTPPRSPFPRFDQSVPMEIPEEYPISEPSAKQEPQLSSLPSLTTVQTEAQTKSLTNPQIQLPNATLEPSPAIVSLTNSELPNPTPSGFETISGVEPPEPRKLPSLPSLPPRVAQDHPAIAPPPLQPQTDGLQDRKPYAIETQNLSPQSKQRASELAPSITEFSAPLTSQPASLKENSMPVESSEILRWLTPTIQDRNQDHNQNRNVEMLLPEPQRRDVDSREMYSEVTASPIASVTQEHSPKGNAIHIGAIDIQIMPATVEPVAIAPSPTKSISTIPLARSFSGSFGLRQG